MPVVSLNDPNINVNAYWCTETFGRY